MEKNLKCPKCSSSSVYKTGLTNWAESSAGTASVPIHYKCDSCKSFFYFPGKKKKI